MEVSNIYHKEQLPKSYYMINHLIMIVIDRDRTCFCFKCYKSNFNYGCYLSYFYIWFLYSWKVHKLWLILIYIYCYFFIELLAEKNSWFSQVQSLKISIICYWNIISFQQSRKGSNSWLFGWHLSIHYSHFIYLITSLIKNLTKIFFYCIKLHNIPVMMDI